MEQGLFKLTAMHKLPTSDPTQRDPEHDSTGSFRFGGSNVGANANEPKWSKNSLLSSRRGA